MRVLLLVSFLLLLTPTAQARLGETKEQLVARFGQISLETSGPLGPYMEFTKTGFVIKVSLIGNRSVAETYEKQTGDVITNEEQQHLLEINSLGSKWVETTAPGNADRTWKQEDGNVAKFTNTGSSRIEFTSKECLDAIAEDFKKKHFSSTDGF